jgi:hypothetical protein
VAEYPHRGPNISRFSPEGVGGFIYALTPVVILLLVAPRLLAVALAGGLAVAPALYYRAHGYPQNVTSLSGGIAGFVLGIGLALVLGTHPVFRMIVLACVSGGLLAAVYLSWRASRVNHPSIRDHGR